MTNLRCHIQLFNVIYQAHYIARTGKKCCWVRISIRYSKVVYFSRIRNATTFLPFNYLLYAYCWIVSLATNEMSLMFSIFVKQKSAEYLEAEISDKGISLVPLYASIEKLRKAATRIKNDIKVRHEFYL